MAEICRRLDGIPLAIELAAARVKILSPRQLRQRLDERFGCSPAAAATLAASADAARAHRLELRLLDERERALFCRLGIFVNGFTLEGAVAVAGDVDEFEVFDLLASLVDKSLVLAEPAGEAVRYRLLESTRVYAREKLGATARTRRLRRTTSAISERPVCCCARAANSDGRRAEPEVLLRSELEDVRAALDAALVLREIAAGARLAAAIGDFRESVGAHSEGLARCEAFLAVLDQSDTRLLADLAYAVSHLATVSLRMDRAYEIAALALRAARATGDRVTLALALEHSIYTAARSRRIDEVPPFLAEIERLGNLPVGPELLILQARAMFEGRSGRLEEQIALLDAMRLKSRALGNAKSELIATTNVAEAEHERGSTLHAIELLRGILPLCRRADRPCELANLAGYLIAVDDFEAADSAAREALQLLSRHDADSPIIAAAIEHLALIRALADDLHPAATLMGYAESAYQKSGTVREFTERTTHDRLSALLQARLDLATLDRLSAQGAALVPDSAIALALATPTTAASATSPSATTLSATTA